jgi:putative heme-binding domain-containing protein
MGNIRMKPKHKARGIFPLAALACLAAAFAAHAQDLPAGPGKAEFERICSSCHSVTIVTRQRMTNLQWLGVVSDMASRGAQGNADELHSIVTYLSTNFGAGSPAAAPAPSAAPTVEQKAMPPLTEAQITKANGLMNTNGCLSCHRIGETGAYLAPDLTDIGGHRSPEQIRASLVSPNPAVLPENRSVRLVTSDGQVVTGKLLNQDGFSVQIMDSSSQLRAFKKASLREFSILKTNPMPSYADKMSAQDLTDLVDYLASLKVQP